MLSVASLREIFASDPDLVSEVSSEYKVCFRNVNTEVDLRRLRSELASIRSCDSAAALFECEDGESFSTFIGPSNSNEELERLANDIHDCIEDDSCYRVEIEVKKHVSGDGEYTVYCLAEFSNWFLGWSVVDILTTINGVIERREGQDKRGAVLSRVLFPNDSERELRFESLSEEVARSSVIEKRKEVVNIDGFEKLLAIPQDFSLIAYSGIDEEIINKLKSLCSMLSFAYLTNTSSFSSNLVSFSIRGASEIQGVFSLGDKRLCDSSVYDLYSWIYTGGIIYDKMEIARNILCSHSDVTQILPVSKETVAAIKNSYRLFLRDNVKEYLAARSKLSASIGEYCDHVADCVSDYTGDFKKNLVGIFGYAITTLFVKQIDKLKPGYLTPGITKVSFLVLLASLVFGWVMFRCYIERVGYYNSMIEAVCEGFKDVFSEEEMKRIVANHPQRMKSLRYFRFWTWLLAILWSLLCLAGFIVLYNLS